MRKYMLIAATLSIIGGMCATTGCQTATPSKAQSAEINADVINVTSGGAAYCTLLNNYTNLPAAEFAVVVDSIAGLASATECNVISQAMTNETGGDESNSQTASGPDVKTDLKIPLGDSAIDGFAALANECAKGAAEGLSASDSTTSADADCPDGNCEPAAPE